MVKKKDPVLYSEAQILTFVDDFALYKGKQKPPWFCIFEGQAFNAWSKRGLVERVLEFNELSKEE